ncbi:MAG: polysaccharide deacetylase family protein [Bacteroidota bacterium]
MMKTSFCSLCIFVLLCFINCNDRAGQVAIQDAASIQQLPTDQDSLPKISFTFDDGITRNLANYSFKEWNGMILAALDTHGLKATFFVTAANKLDKKGHCLLNSWDERGHQIANHTFSHPK